MESSKELLKHPNCFGVIIEQVLLEDSSHRKIMLLSDGLTGVVDKEDGTFFKNSYSFACKPLFVSRILEELGNRGVWDLSKFEGSDDLYLDGTILRIEVFEGSGGKRLFFEHENPDPSINPRFRSLIEMVRYLLGVSSFKLKLKWKLNLKFK